MSYYDDQLYVFGGIHDITWELDDLHIYSLKVNLLWFRITNGPLCSMILQEKLIKKFIKGINKIKTLTKRAVERKRIGIKLIPLP